MKERLDYSRFLGPFLPSPGFLPFPGLGLGFGLGLGEGSWVSDTSQEYWRDLNF